MRYMLHFLFVLCVVAIGVAQAQGVSQHDYAPGYGPTGVATTGDDRNDAPGLEAGSESMSKATATLDIPPVQIIPVIDGVLSPGEWSDAVQINPANLTGTSTAWMKIDACYLHFAAKIPTTLYGTNSNATMVNIWFDLDRDGVWDITGDLDGNLALPAGGHMYTSNVATFGYASLPGWTLSGGRLRYHRPWQTAGVTVPNEQITVVRTFPNASECWIEASIDYRTSPMKLTGGTTANMRIQFYHGYYLSNGSGTVTIMAAWPNLNGSAYFTGPTPAELVDVLPADVVAPPDALDISSIDVEDNPLFQSKAFEIGGQMTAAVQYTSTAPPATTPYVVNIYGPHPSTTLFTSYAGSLTAAQASGTATIPIPVNMPKGFYRVEIIVDDPWVCGVQKVEGAANILVLLPGETPCTVWPGDVNRDEIVNYGDRAALNTYIHDANLRFDWLNGPGRLAPKYPTPLAEYEWTGQAAAPWLTSEGCHMDADGNSVINNFDYIAIKMNWMRATGEVSAKTEPGSMPLRFGVSQNYPNPFNPTTAIQLALPERAEVHLVVHDMLGRTVATLVDGTLDAGVRTIQFDASGLASGTYFATAIMTGIESGVSFRHVVSMSLNK